LIELNEDSTAFTHLLIAKQEGEGDKRYQSTSRIFFMVFYSCTMELGISLLGFAYPKSEELDNGHIFLFFFLF